MKKLAFIFLFAGILSCKDDKKAEPEFQSENFTSSLNAKLWNGLMEIQKNDQNDSLTFLAIVQPGSEEVLVIV